MSKADTPVEVFKRALAHATRSLAEQPDLEVSFASDGPRLSGKIAVLPHPPRDMSDRDGTRNSTWPCGASCSAMQSEVKVLPVPQAMISLPRSASANPASTAAKASRWCGRNSLGAASLISSR